ncbi:hypothetical protein NC652_024103 [Populus alba x Populus x berolinensis]|nr:hypothetical protein NC652_024103 [Populus alba x Populus x berolinensis]
MGIYASHLPKETPFQAPLLELRHGKLSPPSKLALDSDQRHAFINQQVACAFTGLCCALIRRAAQLAAFPNKALLVNPEKKKKKRKCLQVQA